jgi:hypothetical protein
MNAKPLRDLWFRFAQNTELENKLNAQDIAIALSKQGLIELVAHRSRSTFEHYVDTQAMRSIRKVERASEIQRILSEYFEQKENVKL